MKIEDKYELIESYIQGSISQEDKLKFETELAENEDLRKEYHLHRDLHEDFTDDVLDLKSKLNEITTKSSTLKIVDRKGTSKLSLWIKLSSLAAAILLGVIFLPTLFQDGLSPDQIYASYYEPYPMALNQRGSDENKDNITLNTAIQAYLDKKYGEAASAFGTLYTQDQNDVYLLYKANALQADDQVNDAVDNYNIIIENANPKYTEQAQWFKALALIKQGNNRAALQLLESLDETHYQKEKIRKIIRTLK